MDLFDRIRPTAASSAILRPLWEHMITLHGGPHELSRRSGIPSYTIAGYFLGKENVTEEALSTLRSAIAAHRELIAGIRFGYGVARKLERALHLPDKSLDFLGIRIWLCFRLDDERVAIDAKTGFGCCFLSGVGLS